MTGPDHAPDGVAVGPDVTGPDAADGPAIALERNLLIDCVSATLARRRTDLELSLGDPWCQVFPRAYWSRKQGWKLHVSATPLAAPLVLARCAEILVRKGSPFKFARTLGIVEYLGSRAYERGGGGKFITVYPRCPDDELPGLAEELHRATESLPGPAILSDRPYRRGSLVHYRYGAFHGVPMLGNEGRYEVMLMAPDASLVLDERKAWYTPPAWAPPDPFSPPADPQTGGPQTGGRQDSQPRRTAPSSVLLDGRFLVLEVVRHSFAGGVYRALDQQTGEEVIVKQGRRYSGGHPDGTDARDVRRYEARMLERLADSAVTPRLVKLFEQQGDVFLAQQKLDAVTLRQWIIDNGTDDGSAWGPDPAATLAIAANLVGLVELAHGAGYVLRDFNPSNVMVDQEHRAHLIDLEMLAVPGEPVHQGFTPGYAAPEHTDAGRFAPAPDFAVDLFSLGATLFHLATGLDPQLPEDDPPVRPVRDRIGAWLAHLRLTNEAADRLADLIVALLHENPAERPELATVRHLLAQAGARPGGAARPVAPPTPDLKKLVSDGVEHLVATMDLDDDQRLWPCGASGVRTDPMSVQHGAAGVLAVLTRAWQAEPHPTLHTAVRAAAGWIAGRLTREPRVLPGLHFGRAGTAWALLDAATALEDHRLRQRAVALARQLPTRWPNPDVCHGMAGAGLTMLRFWEVTGDAEFLARAGRLADAVTDAADLDGDDHVRWTIPRDFASAMAGLTHYGFAHGAAGIGTFLLAAGRANGEQRWLDLAGRAAKTLCTAARCDDGAAYWTMGPDDTGSLRANWCSGSSGVGTFLLRMWQHNGDPALPELLDQAAWAVWRTRWHAGPAQCHGLSGDGEFLLDLAAATGERRYRDWAEELVVSLAVRSALRDGRLVSGDETRTEVVADFNTGLAGVVAYLLRLRDGGSRLWLPDLLAPAEQRSPAQPPGRAEPEPDATG